MYHRFRNALTTYPLEAKVFSRKELKKWEHDNGKRDAFVHRRGDESPILCTLKGVINPADDDHRGISLFRALSDDDKGFIYAHDRLSERSNSSKCYVSAAPAENGYSQLFEDRIITYKRKPEDVNKPEQFQAHHAFLFPTRDDITVTDFNERAECRKPEGAWTPCEIAANAETVDLPNTPDGDVDAACLLLEALISSESTLVAQRFLAAWCQYYIASSFKDLQGHPDQIASFGNGLVADLFIEAAELRKELGSPQYPTPEMDNLITCAITTKRDHLFIALFDVASHDQIAAKLKEKAAHSSDVDLDAPEDSSSGDLDAVVALRSCSQQFLVARGYSVPEIMVCSAHSLILECFCFPQVKDEDILELISNPLHNEHYTFTLDGTNRHAEKAIDILEPNNDDEEDPVEDVCLHLEFLNLRKSSPMKCREKSIPDSIFMASIQCKGTTKKNIQCKNKTLNANGFCHLHQKQIEHA